MSLQIIQKLHANGIKCVTLTKGISPFELSKYSKENEYGITLVSLDEDFRQRMEPYTAPYEEHIQSLRNLHDAGFYTWVSIEPYPTTNIYEQDLMPILELISFVEKIIFGRMHYNKQVSAYKDHKAFYNNLAHQVIDFCTEHPKDYYIKTGTLTDL